MSLIDLKLEDISSCPLCGNGVSTEYDRCEDSLCPEINRYLPAGEPRLPTIANVRRRCAACGLLFLSPRLNQSSLALIYALWYRYAFRAMFDGREDIRARQKELERCHLLELRRASPVPGKLLDVGCGDGLFMRAVRELGWTGVGIELDPDTAEAGRKTYGLDIRTGTIHDALAANERFDAITLFDYLEHTVSPGKDLEAVAKRLVPGAVVLGRVPNMGGWQSRWMGRKWLAMISDHLSYFTPAVLVGALESRGLRVESVSARNCRPQLDIVRQRLRWMGRRMGSAMYCGSKRVCTVPQPTGGIFGAMSRLAYGSFVEQVDHFGGCFGKGNNLFVVARNTGS